MMDKTPGKHLIVAVWVAVLLYPAMAQWEKTAPVNGGIITSIAGCDSLLVAANMAGDVFRSNDKGNTWHHILAPALISIGYPGPLFVNKKGIYAQHLSFGIEWATWTLQFSGDGGTNWSAIHYPFSHSYISAFAFCDTILFAAVVNFSTNEVYRSTDYGANWEKIAIDLDTTLVSSIEVVDSTIIISTHGSEGVISTDYGTTWKMFSPGIDNINVLSLAENKGTLYAATGNGILKSSNTGRTWTYDSSVNPVITDLVIKDEMLFASTRNGVFRSTDGGITWREMDTGINNKYIFDLAIIEDMIFAGSKGDGLFRSDDNGETWVPVNDGLKNDYVAGLAAQGRSVYAAISYGGIVSSSDEGEHWIAGNLGLNHIYGVNSITIQKNAVFTGTAQYGIFRSDNNGAAWSASSFGLADVDTISGWVGTDIVALATDDSSLVVSSIRKGIFCSIDNGKVWYNTASGFYFTSLSAFSNGGDGTIYVGADAYQCYISTDHGVTWQFTEPVVSKTNSVYSVAVFGNRIYAGTKNGLFQSADTGKTWGDADEGLPQTTVWELAVLKNILLAGTDSGCFFLGADGEYWKQVGSNFTTNRVTALAATDSMFFAVTNDGIWRYPHAEITGIKDRRFPDTIKNRTGSGITITCRAFRNVEVIIDLERTDHIELSIYDIRGRLVKSVIDSRLPAGNHTFHWRPGTAGCGNYYFRTEVGKDVFVKCLTVLR